MELVKSFEEACANLKYSTALPDVSMLPAKHQKAMLAIYQLIIITEALNMQDGKVWEPNWKDGGEAKYYPWFDMDKEGVPSGVGFAGAGYGNWGSGVGSHPLRRTLVAASARAEAKTDTRNPTPDT